jgi:hypothetical protein
MAKKHLQLPIIIIAVIITASLFSSCKKFVEIPPPPNELVSSQVFADSADATSAVLDLYISIMSSVTSPGPLNGDVTIYAGLYSDELVSTTGNTDDMNFYINSIPSDSYLIELLWSQFYSYIYKANACIEGLSASGTISTQAKNQLLGEAKIVRSLVYLNFVNLYGAVPLITTTAYSTNAVLPRTSTDSVYTQIISDLESAQNLMSETYPSTGRVRPNSFTATALLARVFLYRQEWDSAEAASSRVINSGIYALEQNLNNVFLAGSNEAIWQIQPIQQGYETAEGIIFVPTDTTVVPNYYLNSPLLSAFEAGDQRRIDWLDSNEISGIAYYYPFKYKLGNDGLSTPLEDYMICRLAEMYLIRSEARAEQSEANSISDLNTVRNRAGLSSLNLTVKSDLLNAIYHERQIELFCEEGHRWYDLKRIGLANTYMPTIDSLKGGAWSSNDLLWPIPLTELQDNRMLTQNPGY